MGIQLLDMPTIGLFFRYVKMKQMLGRIKKELAMSEEALQAYRLFKLKKVMAYAHTHVAMYREKWRNAGVHPNDLKTIDDLVKFPVVTKDDLRSVCANGLGQEKGRSRNGYLFKTSGSTGTPICVEYERERGFYEIAVMSHFSLNYHLKTNLKMGMIISVMDDDAIDLLPTREFPGAKRFVVDALESPDAQIDRINDMKPDYLGTYPSVLKNIALRAKEKKIALHQPKLLISSGESQDAHTRRIIQEAFNGVLLDTYISTEAGVMASECLKHNGLHVLSYKTIIEITDDRHQVLPDGQTGNVVVTDLNNLTFPVIRYDGMGDISGYRKERCDCHLKHLPLLARIEGRKVDSVVLPDNQVIHPFKLTLLMQDVPGIKKFQIRQEKKNEIRILMVKNASRTADTKAIDDLFWEKLKNRFQSIVGRGVSVRFEDVPDIPKKDNSHKFQTVVSLIHK
jgi:phenylacetate-CoA ligase